MGGKMVVNKFLKAWNWTEKNIGGVFILVATILAFSGTVMRYCFSYSVEWFEQVIIYLIIWSTFIVISLLTEENKHVCATFLVIRFSRNVRRVIDIVACVPPLIFCALCSYWGWQIVNMAYITGERSTTSLNAPLWIMYMAIPTGLALVVIRYIRRIYRLLFKFETISYLESDHAHGSEFENGESA